MKILLLHRVIVWTSSVMKMLLLQFVIKLKTTTKKTVAMLEKFQMLLCAKTQFLEKILSKGRNRCFMRCRKRGKDEGMIIEDFEVMLQSLTSIIHCFKYFLF